MDAADEGDKTDREGKKGSCATLSTQRLAGWHTLGLPGQDDRVLDCRCRTVTAAERLLVVCLASVDFCRCVDWGQESVGRQESLCVGLDCTLSAVCRCAAEREAGQQICMVSLTTVPFRTPRSFSSLLPTFPSTRTSQHNRAGAQGRNAGRGEWQGRGGCVVGGG